MVIFFQIYDIHIIPVELVKEFLFQGSSSLPDKAPIFQNKRLDMRPYPTHSICAASRSFCPLKRTASSNSSSAVSRGNLCAWIRYDWMELDNTSCVIK